MLHDLTITTHLLRLLAIILPVVHFSGVCLALDAVWQTRTSQGATAWAVSLISFPYLSIPLYLIFGRTRFQGYVSARRSHDEVLKGISERLLARAKRTDVALPSTDELPAFRVLQNLARMPFTRGNSVGLLIDGEATFAAIFRAIESAREYVLVQFFIVRDDELGNKLGDLLSRKAAEGIPCYFLYDEVGSQSTPKRYWRNLSEKGVKVSAFNTRGGGWRNRLQINFRNHRKIVLVDGICAFVGGHNVGDEYLGRGPLGPWRDTHVEVAGPVVAAIQLSFVEDWHWARGEVLQLQWDRNDNDGGSIAALALPTGPADEVDTCALLFSQLIQTARRRLWMASPYFVPDPQIISQLKLAALRGVDVRILLPGKPDHKLPYLASFAYIEQVERLGVKIFRYEPGFPHQKVVLIDDEGASIGTANLDNRSFRLNFEISLLFAGKSLADATAKMLEADFARAHRVPVGLLGKRKFFFRLAVRIARLFAPIL